MVAPSRAGNATIGDAGAFSFFPTKILGAFAIGEGASLEFLGESSSGGKNPCHVAVDATGRTVAIANYSDGSIVTVRLASDGTPEAPVSGVRNEGSGPNERRQEGPHALHADARAGVRPRRDDPHR